MSAINKQDLRDAITKFREAIKKFRKATVYTVVLVPLANTFTFSIAKFKIITLENTRDALYNFIVDIKDIKTWKELTDGIATIVNNTFRAVYNEDIMTKESFNEYLTGESKSQGPMESKSRPPPRIHPDLLEAMREARAAGWGKPPPQPQLIPHGAPPMLRQTSISDLPYDDWTETEVLGATFGSSEDSEPSYSPEIAEMMMVEGPEMRQKQQTEEKLWSDAAHVARARRYQKEGRDVRQDDKMTLSRLGKQGGKRKTKRKRKTRKRKTKRKRKTRKRKKRRKKKKTRRKN